MCVLVFYPNLLSVLLHTELRKSPTEVLLRFKGSFIGLFSGPSERGRLPTTTPRLPLRPLLTTLLSRLKERTTKDNVHMGRENPRNL